MRTVITGGIGSGKSYVCRLLEQRGIAIYDCDAAAKRLMANSAELQQKLCRLVGDDVYSDGRLQKAVLTKFLLASEANKQAVNDVVHPAVADDFNRSGLNWMECAIFFESGFFRRVSMDLVVCVAAPDEVRIERIMERDHLSRRKAKEWVDSQMPQDEILTLSDMRIINDGCTELEPQIDELLQRIDNT